MTLNQHNKLDTSLSLPKGIEKHVTQTTIIHIVFLHGWGMNKGIWAHFIEQCREQYSREHRHNKRIEISFKALDLPGFGERANDNINDYSLQDFANVINAQLTQASIVVGWSFGGLVAQYLANGDYPNLIAHVQIASSPKFVATTQWAGINHDVLNDFHTQLSNDQRALIKRFIAIQCMGLANAKNTIKEITELLTQYPPSHQKSLAKTLDLLIETDLRAILRNSDLPCLRIYGRLDTLVPAKAIEMIDKHCQSSESVIIKKASHAPFISHPQDTADLILDFVVKNIKTDPKVK